MNFPYTSEYEPKLLALVTALIAVERIPRATVELPAGKQRLERIVHLIDSCRTSIHEMSPPSGDLRLNMPFELGIACKAAIDNEPPHQFFLLEEQPYRLQRTLSDLNGFDPLIHQGKEDRVISCVFSMLPLAAGNPPVGRNKSLLATVRAGIQQLKTDEGADSILSVDMWAKSVSLITGAATSAGFISP